MQNTSASLRVFESFESPLLGPDALRKPPPLSRQVGVDRHSRVRAMMRKEGVTGVLVVSNPEDMQAGDYLVGNTGGWMGAIVHLPLDGEPLAFAPPDTSPLMEPLRIRAMEAAGNPVWVKEWVFGYDGAPAFARKLGERIQAGAMVGGVNLIGTPLGNYLQTVLPQINFKNLTDPYNTVRGIKIGEEQASVRTACAATEATAEMLTKTIVAGATEAEVTGTVRCNIGRYGIVISDVPLASIDGFGAPIAPASFRTMANVGISFGATWRSRGAKSPVLKRGQLISTKVRCWSEGTEAHLHLTVSLGKLSGNRARIATLLNETLQRACDAIKPGVSLGDLNQRIAEWLGQPPVSHSPYCYLLNPIRAPAASGGAAGDPVLQEGMQVHLNPYVMGSEMMGVSCGVLVGASRAERLNDTPCRVQIV